MNTRFHVISLAFTLVMGWSISFANAETPPAQQDLYLEAMRSISEGRKTDASEALTRMIEQEPQHAGAWLDLALIQCELGRADKAEQLFQIIESRFSPPQGIRDVIANQRARGCKSWQSNNQTTIVIGRGADNNANQGASNPNVSLGNGDRRIDLQLLPEYLPKADEYSLLSIDFTHELSPNGSLGFAQLQTRQNDALSQYNTVSVAAGVDMPWHMTNWGLNTIGTVGALTLGGKLYQQQASLQARISPPVSLPKGFQFHALTSAAYIYYPTLDHFNANMLEMRGILHYQVKHMQAHASFGYLYDRATSIRPGGDRHGWYAHIQGRQRLTDHIFGELGWSLQTWTGKTAYSPGLIDEVRFQRTHTLQGALVVPVTDQQSLHLELRHVRNNENISVFQYSNSQFQLTWQWRN